MSRKSLNNLNRQKNTTVTEITDGYTGFEALSEIVEYYIKKTEPDNVTEVLLAGAKEFVSDLNKLPKPMSKIRKAGYTHLVRCFAWDIDSRGRKEEVVVGWGKYYGRIVEKGHRIVIRNQYMKKKGVPAIDTGDYKTSKPHIEPLWNRNSGKYYKTMLTKLDLHTW